MEYTSEQAKSIYTLILQADSYAFPLLLSLLLPLVWVILKRLLGLYDKKEEGGQLMEKESWMKKFLRKVMVWIKIQGSRADQRVFVVSIALFITGGIALKYREYNEEKIRQRTLVLKAIFKSNNALAISTKSARFDGFSNNEVEKICSRYPREFVVLPPILDSTKVDKPTDSTVVCTDSLYYQEYKNRVFPLIASYLDYQFALNSNAIIDEQTLFDKHNTIRNLFLRNVVFDFLSDKKNEEKYFISAFKDTANNQFTYILKRASYTPPLNQTAH